MNNRAQVLCKICFLLAIGLGVLPVFAETETDDNNIKMVTYFPVPYAAYNAVFTTQKLDVGTAKDASFTLNLGDSACTDGSSVLPSLTTGDTGNAVLTYSTNNSSLSFGTDIYTNTATFGTAVTNQVNTLRFLTNLRVNNVASSTTAALQQVTGNNEVVGQDKAFIFPGSFSSTDKAALPSCELGTVTWQELALGNDSQKHYFLTCGGIQSCQGNDAELEARCVNATNDPNYVEGNWGSTSANCQCKCPSSSTRNTQLTADKQHCKCKEGYKKYSVSACVEIPCYKNTHLNLFNACEGNGHGHWMANENYTASQCCECDPGYRLNTYSGACDELPCYKNTHLSKYNACTSGSKGTWNENGSSASACCTCIANFILQDDGTCKCSTQDASTNSRYTHCSAASLPIPNRVVGTWSFETCSCTCPSGSVIDASGACMRTGGYN